ncbi:hypothetical protein OEZ85_011338 [Tetradesmus obliquus]|uniref:Spindle assembly abnormal protein 6 N-terminal domain-containing protein n=1 Tax=Tetradesmus obliquus TaxID=3088 RepID=A0ABY8TSC9_TETOB|nr:hypothetical protein OEZ85_011338 [Tetradesmus obliquus]
MEDPAQVLGYSELIQRVVPIELRSFPSSTLLQRLFTSSSCPSGLKELYSDLSDSAEGTSKSTLSGCSSPMSTTNSSAGVEMMKVRVLSHVVGGITTSVRVELSCDASLFFHYSANVSPSAYEDIKEDCGLVVDFASFPALLLKLLNLLVEQPSTYLGLLVLRADGSAVLEFAQNLEFKAMSLLSMRVEAVPQAMVRGYVTMRHNSVLERCAELEAELFELRSLVRQRCPNLLQLGKTARASPMTSPASMRSTQSPTHNNYAITEPALVQAGDTPFRQPCTLKGVASAAYAGALGYFLGFVPAAIKFKGRQWGMVHAQGVASASQLAVMSGMYTAVHCICQRIRSVEDGWNRGIAGCSTGLVLGWKAGPWPCVA